MKILIVEDERTLVKYLKRILEKKGFTVLECYDGNDALQFIEMNYQALDLIILDIALPGLSGDVICKKIRKEHITTPIIILTARDAVTDKIMGLNYGADDYVSKPFSANELVARIRALLRRPKNMISDVIHAGNVTIWTQKQKVFKNRKEIKLTLKEYQLLRYFVTNPDRVIEREELLEKLWDINYNSFSNVVDAQIKNLRKKLRLTQKPCILETVRGVGFRITFEPFSHT